MAAITTFGGSVPSCWSSLSRAVVVESSFPFLALTGHPSHASNVGGRAPAKLSRSLTHGSTSAAFGTTISIVPGTSTARAVVASAAEDPQPPSMVPLRPLASAARKSTQASRLARSSVIARNPPSAGRDLAAVVIVGESPSPRILISLLHQRLGRLPHQLAVRFLGWIFSICA